MKALGMYYRTWIDTYKIELWLTADIYKGKIIDRTKLSKQFDLESETTEELLFKLLAQLKKFLTKQNPNWKTLRVRVWETDNLSLQAEVRK